VRSSIMISSRIGISVFAYGVAPYPASGGKPSTIAHHAGKQPFRTEFERYLLKGFDKARRLYFRAYLLLMESKAGSKFLFYRASLSESRFSLFRTHSRLVANAMPAIRWQSHAICGQICGLFCPASCPRRDRASKDSPVSSPKH
jgi:hypothetical protein